MFANMLSLWDAPRVQVNQKISVTPHIDPNKVAKAKRRKQKRKTGGHR